MTEQSALPPVPPNNPACEGFDDKYFTARALARLDYERGGYQGKQREAKGKTQIQLWYRDLAIQRKQKREQESSDNERPTNE